MDKRILELFSDSRFERDLYEAAVRNLADTENKLRFNNFAYAMRELTRHMLHRLAPSDEVRKCVWWKSEIKGMKKKDDVTRVERAIYATQGGLSNHYMTKKLNLDFNESHEVLRDAIEQLSKYTHIELSVFGLSDGEVTRLVEEITSAVAGLAMAIKDCRSAVADRLSDAIGDAAVQQVLETSLPEVDELATHYFAEEVVVYEQEVLSITSDSIFLRASGTIGVTLQWGSNSDVRNGDGAQGKDTFDFTCELTGSTKAPDSDKLEYIENSISIDTDHWFDTEDARDDEPDAPAVVVTKGLDF